MARDFLARATLLCFPPAIPARALFPRGPVRPHRQIALRRPPRTPDPPRRRLKTPYPSISWRHAAHFFSPGRLGDDLRTMLSVMLSNIICTFPFPCAADLISLACYLGKGFTVCSTSASKYYLDLDIPQVQEFHARCILSEFSDL